LEYKEEIEEDLEDEQPEKKSLLREILGFIGYVAFIAIFTYVVITFIGQRTEVVGSSMYPTLENGDNLLVDKLSYRLKKIERYDIVVFRYHTGEYFIKRVIGLPGETVQIIDGEVYINGELLGEDYGYEVMENAYRAEEPVVLGENEYFVLGDNRNDSTDSRDERVGNVDKSLIIGKAFIRIFPFDSFGLLKHQ